MLVVLEGVDGCGKSTQAKALAKHFAGSTYFEFPERGSLTGRAIDKILKGELNLEGVEGEEQLLTAVLLQSLMACNRLESNLRLAVANNLHVFCARYTHSGFVYGNLDGLSLNFVADINVAVPTPDLCILLAVDTDTAMARKGKTDLERYEKDKEVVDRLVKGYYDLWRERMHKEWVHTEMVRRVSKGFSDPKTAEDYERRAVTRYHVVDGTLPTDSVTNKIIDLIAA